MVHVKSLKTAFALLIGVIALSIISIVLAQYLGNRDLLVNGPKYAEIVADKDLVADILPPPGYIVESYLLTLQLRNASSAHSKELLSRLDKTHSDFEDRHAYWQKDATTPEEVKRVMGEAHTTGAAFYDEIYHNYLPALRAADTKAADEALAAADSLYEKHRASVDQAVQLATTEQAKDENSAADAIAAATRRLGLIGTLLLAFTLWLAYQILSSIRRMVGGEPSVANAILSEIAQGKLDNAIPLAAGDTSSLMANVNAMQIQLTSRDKREKSLAAEMLRIKIALDNASTAVMIADANRTIVYANRAVKRVLKEAEADLKKVLPTFNADKLVGESIDQFHKNPAHQAAMLATLTKTQTAQLTIGARRMQVVANPVVSETGERLGAVAEWLDRTAELALAEREAHIAAENLRIKIALDGSSTGMMIADNDRNIVYTNAAVTKMLRNAEASIRKQLPTFSVDKLIGTNIDSFHKNPSHQAKLLAEFTQTYVAPLVIGGRNLVVTANPVIDAQGKRLGAVAEWVDRTLEVQVENEVANLIQAAGQGNFEARLALEGKEGFFLKLAEGLNQLSATVSAGLTDVGKVLQAVAQGDLTRTIDADYQGLFGELKDNTNTTIERLREVIGRIQEATDLINTAAKEIAAGNTDLSSRTEEQASSLEETASSMEELNSTVKQNAENAFQANQLAKTSNDTAVKSGQMVQQIVSTMNGISESSKKIADIIGVIDSIAFQTNILALNAAVEAARAGEQGRGFAVVATEVRNLAQRSATAAKEIKELIAESTGKVDAGTKLVDQAGVSMEAVVTSFQQVTALVTDIANASREQSSGIEQVTQAVGQMDEVTQQNAALVEEAAAAAESLEEQASGLARAVAMFKLDSRTSGTRNLPGSALRSTPAPRQIAGEGGTRAGAGAGRKLSAPRANDVGDEWEEF